VKEAEPSAAGNQAATTSRAYGYTPLREEQIPSYDCIDPDYLFEAYIWL